MKKRFLRKLKIILIISLILVVGVSIFVLLDPQGSINKLTYYADVLISKYYNGSLVPENIELPEAESLTQAQKYFYYQQLDESAKKIYVTIEKNIDKMIEGEDNIPLPNSLNEYAKNNGKEEVAKQFQNAWDAFITDKSEYFYIDSSKVCLVTESTTRGKVTEYKFFIGKGDNKTYFSKGFNSKEDVEKAKQEIEVATQEILQNATGNNYQKMLYVHDYIIDNTDYKDNSYYSANMYGCLINKSAICEGYARTYKYLLDKLEIPCILVSGDAINENGRTERHAWNYVYINNNWYIVDTTWDDPIIIGNGKVNDKVKHKYFLKGYNTISNSHIVSGKITQSGMNFEIPKLSEDDLV